MPESILSAPPNRHPVGPERDDRQDRAAAAKVIGSTGLTPKTSDAEESCRQERRGQADGDADGDERQAARQHQSQHVAALRAKRDADADFARALRDAVRHDAVETHGGEQHRDAAKRRAAA